jgi:DNA-binding transcriptional ArsR family regulator
MRARDGQKRNAEHFQSQMEGRRGLDASKLESVGKKKRLTLFLYFCNSRTMEKPDPLLVAIRRALSGTRRRASAGDSAAAALRSPDRNDRGEVQEELEIPASTLSYQLEKLKQVELVNVRRVGTFLWYSANTAKLFRARFESIDIEATRVYKTDQARDFLGSTGLDVENVKPLIDGKFISAFARGAKTKRSRNRRWTVSLCADLL